MPRRQPTEAELWTAEFEYAVRRWGMPNAFYEIGFGRPGSAGEPFDPRANLMKVPPHVVRHYVDIYDPHKGLLECPHYAIVHWPDELRAQIESNIEQIVWTGLWDRFVDAAPDIVEDGIVRHAKPDRVFRVAPDQLPRFLPQVLTVAERYPDHALRDLPSMVLREYPELAVAAFKGLQQKA